MWCCFRRRSVIVAFCVALLRCLELASKGLVATTSRSREHVKVATVLLDSFTALYIDRLARNPLWHYYLHAAAIRLRNVECICSILAPCKPPQACGQDCGRTRLRDISSLVRIIQRRYILQGSRRNVSSASAMSC